MSNKLKRLLAFVLAAAMMMSLAACGNDVDETPEQTKAPEGTNAPEQTDAPEDPDDPYGKYDETIKITLGNQIAESGTLANGDTYNNNALWDYIKETLNIELEYEIEAPSSSDYTTALSLAITGEDIPDIVQCYDYAQMVELVEAGLVWDLTELYEQYANDTVREFYAGFDYDVFEKVTFDGKVMAIPRGATEAGSVFYIRQDWLDKLNIKVDEDGDGLITRDELKMIASEFLKNDPGNSGNPVGLAVRAYDGTGYNQNPNIIFNSFGAKVNWWTKAEDGSFINGSTMAEMKDGLSWLAGLFDEGILDQQYGVTQNADITAMLVNGRLGITNGNLTNPGWSFQDVYAADPEADFIAYGLDNGEGKHEAAWHDMTNRYLMVSKDCEYPEAAIKLLNLVTDFQLGAMDTEEIKTNYPELYENYIGESATNNKLFVDPLLMAYSTATQFEDEVAEVEAYLAGKLAKEDITSSTARTYVEALDKKNAGETLEATDRINLDVYEAKVLWASLSEADKLDMDLHPAQITTDVTALYTADLDELTVDMMIKIITGEESVEYFDTYVEEYGKRGGDAIAEDYKAAFE